MMNVLGFCLAVLHYRLEKLMTVEIKDHQYLVDATDAELSEMNGGYAAAVANRTGNLGLAGQVAGIVLNKSAFDQSVVDRQVALGVPADVIGIGVALAIQGGGRYTPPVTFSKLGD
jgi:hypothetical protein